ncbi:J domain-containing protein [Haloarculaceae archaeon H-GB2-1]|nr:J domain-containing protein [Haloarculaceae archaeon H-GB1-1]MEA5407835.1 J domain-containing protein [Haloarculaceae archaeon H-GB2-1]
MTRSRLVTGLAVVFALISVVLVVLGVRYNPVILFVAALFGVVTYFFWEHGTGRLAARLYRRVERQAARNDGRTASRTADSGSGGFGAGPREAWTGPYRRAGRERARRSRNGQSTTNGTGRYTPAEAYRILNLEPGADQPAIKRAYRAKVREVHPDTAGGDQASFKRVTEAYETLTDG